MIKTGKTISFSSTVNRYNNNKIDGLSFEFTILNYYIATENSEKEVKKYISTKTLSIYKNGKTEYVIPYNM
jgi:hypothetical protein